LKSASTQLARVVSTSPSFQLAKDRYSELLTRLLKAGEKRQQVLSTAQQQLYDTVTRALTDVPDVTKMGPREAGRYFGNRWLRGRLLATAIQQGQNGADSATMLAQLHDFFENNEAQARDEIRWLMLPENMKLPFVTCLMDRHDVEKAEELHIKDADSCAGYREDKALSMAEWATTGNGLRWHPYVKTPLAQLDPQVGERALTLIKWAEADAMRRPDPEDRKRSIAEMRITRGDVLLALGRKEEAIASWQQMLEENPTHHRYQAIENNIRRALGVAEVK
jgi:tetratricopeptide (TPR) repeat protein